MHCLVLVFVLSPAAFGQESGDWTAQRETQQYAADVAKGRAEAETELDLGEATIWTSGLNVGTDFELLDRETGLCFRSFGCVVDDELAGRMEGHNKRIAEYVRGHGLPKYSFKPWEKELFGLKKYFEGRCRTQKPARLTAGGPAVVSPDGEYTVKLVTRLEHGSEGLKAKSTWIVVGEQEVELFTTWLSMSDADFFWGPKGSGFAVLRSHNEVGALRDYMALDLRRVRISRSERGKTNTPDPVTSPFFATSTPLVQP